MATIQIPLTQGKFAVIDEADLSLVSPYRWRATEGDCTWYALGHDPSTGNKTIQMHRLLIGASDDSFVDHRDGDGLNNRRNNIRLATPTQNQGNRRKANGCSSLYKGVCRRHDNGKNCWQARIAVNGKRCHLGYFDSEESAAQAYDIAARNHFGEFACPNFPKDGELGCLAATVFTGA